MIYLWFMAVGFYIIYYSIKTRFAKPAPETPAAEPKTLPLIEHWLLREQMAWIVLRDGPVQVYSFDFNVFHCRINVELRYDPGVPNYRVKIAFPLFFTADQQHIVAACLHNLNQRLTGVYFRLVSSDQRSVVYLNCDQLTDADGKPVSTFQLEDLYRIFQIADQCFPEIHRAVFYHNHPELVAIRAFGPDDFRLN